MLDALEKSDATFRWAIVDACRNDPTERGYNSGFRLVVGRALSDDVLPTSRPTTLQTWSTFW